MTSQSKDLEETKQANQTFEDWVSGKSPKTPKAKNSQAYIHELEELLKE